MANLDAPFGFKAVRHRSGGQLAVNRYRKEASVIIGVGDPVVRTGSASQAGTNNADADGIPLVTRASAGSGTITGTVAYVEIDSDEDRHTHKKHMAAADTGYVYIYDDPNIIFHIQEDGDSSTIAVTDYGEACDIVIANADTDTGYSKAELDSSDAGTGDQCKLLRLVQRPDNALGAYAIHEVLINEHTDQSVTTMI